MRFFARLATDVFAPEGVAGSVGIVRTGTRRPLAALAVAASFLAVPAAFGHGGSNGTFDDIAEAVFEGRSCATSGCHAAPGVKGGLDLTEGAAWAELLGFGFGADPNNAAAQSNGKKRVDPGRPWNSYLVDKLRGHLRSGEGAGMPQVAGTWEPLDECTIREIENWILQGAPRQGFVHGDSRHHGVNGCNVDVNPSCAIDPCATTQPALAAPAPPATGVQLHAASAGPFTGHEAAFRTDVPGGNAAGFVTRIEIVARPGTRSVTVARAGDPLPFVLALGDPASATAPRDVLALPVGYGIPVVANETFTVVQVLRPDAFDPRNPGAHAEAYVNLEISTDPSLVALEPFADDLGTQVLLAPARGQGVTGGLWSAPQGAKIAALRLWTDARAIRGAVLGTPGVVFSLDGSGRTPYRVDGEPFEVLPGSGLAYTCQHDNTALVAPPRLACGTVTAVAAGVPVPPPGLPALVAGDEGPAPWCAAEADCGAGSSCVAANLVGGDGLEDGRCTLLGLRVAE